jgi:uncharacterized membrane protein
MEEHVAKRLTELRPVIAEYEELRKVADRLGISDRLGLNTAATTATGAAEKPDESVGARPTGESPAARGPSARSTRKPAGTRATPDAKDTRGMRARVGSGSASRGRRVATSAGKGSSTRAGTQRDVDIIDAVRSNPGMTVAELGANLGVPATNLYRPIKRLQDRGVIRKTGTRLQPADNTSPATG